MHEINFSDFEIVELRVWTITQVEDNLKAKKSAYKIWADFGEEFWIKKTSAQITEVYIKEELIWKQIIWVLNFPKKLIAWFSSEFLLTWFYSKEWVIIAVPERKIDNWLKLG